jgi:hypothetical protein
MLSFVCNRKRTLTLFFSSCRLEMYQEVCSSSNKFVELHNDEHLVNMRFDSDHPIKLVKHVIKRVKNHLGDI